MMIHEVPRDCVCILKHQNGDADSLLLWLVLQLRMTLNSLQASSNDAKVMLLSIALPSPPPEVVLSGGLPFGAIDAVKASCGSIAQIIDPPESGFHLTLKLDLSKLPADEGTQWLFIFTSI